MKIRRATMAVAMAGAVALAGCTSGGSSDNKTSGSTGSSAGSGSSSSAGTSSDTGSAASGGDAAGSSSAGGDAAAASSGGGAAASGETAKQDLGQITTKDDTISFSSGSEVYNAYNGLTANTNSTYNSVVNGQLGASFWYWGTDGTVYPNTDFGTYEKTSDDPLTIKYTISDKAVWEDGTPITSNDFLLDWASSNPKKLGGAKKLGFDPVSDTFGKYVPDGLKTEVGSKEFTVTYPKPYPDWELVVSSFWPAHIAAKQSGLTGDQLAQAILDGDGDTVAKVSKFWNKGWLFPEYKVTDEALVPSSGPYSLKGSTWDGKQSLTLVPNEKWWGTPPATKNLQFKFAAPETHVQALQNGDINVIEPQATVDTVQQIEGMGDTVQLLRGDQMTWEHLDFNFKKGAVFAEDQGGLAAREAFALCVPREEIVNNLIKPINDKAVVMNLRERFPFQPDYQEVLSAAYDGRYDQPNIEEAKKKLAESGLKTPVKVRIGYSAPNQRRTDEVTTIKSSCDQAGFEIVDANDPKFFEDTGSLAAGDYDIAMFAWAGSGQIASGQPIYSTDGGQNFGGYSNKEVDAAWDTLATTLDEKVQLEQTKKIEKLLWDDLMNIPVFAHPGISAADATIQNVRRTSTQAGITWNAEQWVRNS